jgi:TRAP-type C4-dicarboxylate transport system permease small subunit
MLLRTILGKGVEWICLALMVVLSIDLMLGVVSRYVFARTFTWYDEIARAAFVWVVFLGTAVGIKRSAHFRLHLLVDRFPAPLRRGALGLGVLLIIAFAIVLVWQGWLFLEHGRAQTLPVMGISKAWVYAAMPAGGALVILYSLPLLAQALRARR